MQPLPAQVLRGRGCLYGARDIAGAAAKRPLHYAPNMPAKRAGLHVEGAKTAPGPMYSRAGPAATGFVSALALYRASFCGTQMGKHHILP